MYSSRQFKLDLIDALESRGVYFRRVNDTEYQTRCPSCGDKINNQNTGHLYIHINPNDNSLIVYKCHRCPYSGLMTPDDLELLDVDDKHLKEGLYALNKKGAKYDSKNISNEKETVYNLTIPTINDTAKLAYINHRLGTNFTSDMCQELRIIPSLGEFLNANGIRHITTKPIVARILNANYIGFLTSNGNQILFRDVTEQMKYRWVKYDVFEKTNEDKLNTKNFYALPVSIDPMSTDEIIVNMAEGVMDILSIGYNLGYKRDNCLNVAVGGKYYLAMFNRLIHMGIVGNNVRVNIFSDNDHTYDTSIEYYRRQLSKFKPCFKSIKVFYNRKSKDCGVRKDEIFLTEERL